MQTCACSYNTVIMLIRLCMNSESVRALLTLNSSSRIFVFLGLWQNHFWFIQFVFFLLPHNTSGHHSRMFCLLWIASINAELIYYFPCLFTFEKIDTVYGIRTGISPPPGSISPRYMPIVNCSFLLSHFRFYLIIDMWLYHSLSIFL